MSATPEPVVQSGTPTRTRGGCLRKGAIGCGALVALLVVIGIVAAVAGGGKKATSTTAPVSGATTATAAAAPAVTTTISAPTQVATSPLTAAPSATQPLALGQMARVGDLEVTVSSARWSSSPAISGSRTLIVEATVHYVGRNTYNLSTLLQFQIYGSDNRKYNVTIAMDSQGTLDGTLQADQTLTGDVAFSVPPDAAPYRVRFQKALGSDLAEWRVPAPR